MGDVQEWTSMLCTDLGLSPQQIDYEPLVGLVRDVDRVVAHPAGILTAYLAGIAVAQGRSFAVVARRFDEIRMNWQRIDWRD